MSNDEFRMKKHSNACIFSNARFSQSLRHTTILDMSAVWSRATSDHTARVPRFPDFSPSSRSNGREDHFFNRAVHLIPMLSEANCFIGSGKPRLSYLHPHTNKFICKTTYRWCNQCRRGVSAPMAHENGFYWERGRLARRIWPIPTASRNRSACAASVALLLIARFLKMTAGEDARAPSEPLFSKQIV
jgi:hypothetical protein